MLYNVDFEVAAMIVNFILLIFYAPKKNFRSSSNSLYKFIVVFAFVINIFNIISCWSVSFPEDIPLSLNYIINIAFLLMQNTMPPVFFAYIVSLTEYRKRSSRLRNILMFSPYAFSVLSIISSPLTGLAFYFTDENVYTQGPSMVFMYIIAGAYLIASLVVTFVYRKIIYISNCIAIYCFVLLTLSAVVLQFVFSDILVTGMATACSCLLMYMMLQNTNDKVMQKTGTFSREAFIMSIADCIKMRRRFSVIVVVPDNTKSICSALGFDALDVFMGLIADFLRKEFNFQLYSIEDDSVAFISNDQADEKMYIGIIQERFKKAWNVAGIELVRSCSLCCVTYPDCGDNVEDLLNAVNYSMGEVKTKGEGTVFFPNHIPTKDERLKELELQKNQLEEESREANRAKARAERADKEKSMFLANMSHEIRTPMNAIIGMTDLILRDDINERVRSNANDIKSAGDSLIAIINDVLDISKVESGKMEIQNAEYSVKKLIMDVVKLASTRIQLPRIEFIIDIDMNMPERLIGDEVRLKQVFLNLLNNAAKYTEQGKITFKVGGRVVESKFILHAEVTDTGCGIKRSDIGKLFNTFTRINDEKIRGIEGTGLGLALCKRILQIMGGDIGVESDYGVGSTFLFDVPQMIAGEGRVGDGFSISGGVNALIIEKSARDSQVDRLCRALSGIGIKYRAACGINEVEGVLAKERFTHIFTVKEKYLEYKDWLKEYGGPQVILMVEPDVSYEDVTETRLLYEPVYTLSVRKLIEEERNTARGRFYEAWQAPEAKVLLVDDNRVNLKVISGLLKCFGIVPETAQSGPESIEMAKKKKYDVIIMDHMMPEMDGIEAMHLIREIRPEYEKLPIIVLTANAVYGVRDMFINEGFDDYLTKPIEMQLLSNSLLEHLPAELIVDTADEAESRRRKDKDLPGFTDVDVKKGLEVCAFNRDKYIELLGAVYNSSVTKRTRLKEFREKEDYDSYLLQLQSLQSTVESVGALQLARRIEQLGNAVKRGDYDFVAANADSVDRTYALLIDEIREYLEKREGAEPDENKIYISREDFLDEITAMNAALDDFDDSEAMKHMNKLLNCRHSVEVLAELKRIKQLISVFAYEDAIAATEALKENYTKAD